MCRTSWIHFLSSLNNSHWFSGFSTTHNQEIPRSIAFFLLNKLNYILLKKENDWNFKTGSMLPEPNPLLKYVLQNLRQGRNILYFICIHNFTNGQRIQSGGLDLPEDALFVGQDIQLVVCTMRISGSLYEHYRSGKSCILTIHYSLLTIHFTIHYSRSLFNSTPLITIEHEISVKGSKVFLEGISACSRQRILSMLRDAKYQI